MYTDDQVRQLPDIAADHPCYQEWKVRNRSARKLANALQALGRPLSVLEVGCGNGWLSHRLSQVPGCRVTGIDINRVELSQACRVFGQHPGLQFVAGDIRQGVLTGQQFNLIIFAASIQYFASLQEILDLCLLHLQEQGEIHILDSCFYTSQEMAGARNRSAAYYQRLGVPEMTDYYHHQALEDLAPYPYQVLNRPGWLQQLFPGKVFPWIRIQKQACARIKAPA